jgi:methyl-accepting chemotaxis protein WspA
LFRDASIRGVDSWTAVDPESGEQCYFIGGTVPTGQWRMLVRKPITAVTAGVRSMVISNVRTALAGMVVVVVLLSVGALATARRVRVAQRLAERIASGDLSATEVVVRGSDESAELIRAMNAMNVDLAAIVGTVRGACARLAATSTQLAATSQEQRATVGAFGESTSQIAAAIREISATSGELLQTIASVDAGARKSAESAVNGRVRLDAVASTMTHLDGATKDIADRLQVIAEKAAAISSVVIAISKVAEQTNLLSVNAAIEAEKAGDAGLGFLVVAREIRRLADQTGGASLDIERIVGQMQSSVTAGVDEMARFAVEMQQGTGEVKKVAGELGGIVVAINASFASFSDVRTGMSSQSEGVAQIEQAVVQVATGAQQSTAAAEEFGRVANELAHAVAVLQDAAARFQLRSDVGG